jgi:hypothetical protein
MPMWDLKCSCGWERDDTFVIGEWPSCPQCGAAVSKVWKGKFPSVVDDTIHETIENLGPTPVTFTSRSDKRTYLKMHGISEKVRHVGEAGSDKNRHTSRWI